MTSRVLGRTNRAFPPVWLRLTLSPTLFQGEGLEALVEAAKASGAPLDVSAGPAVLGSYMRGADDLVLIQRSTVDFERATDERHAADLIQAHALQTLSALGRETIDFYLLRVRRAIEERQLSGVLESLEMLRQEGHFKHAGLLCDGPSLATLGLWQFHDAFDVVVMPRNHYDDEAFRTLEPVAGKRRVGLVTTDPLEWRYGLPVTSLGEEANRLKSAMVADLAKDHPVIVNVQSAEDVEWALSAATAPVPEDFAERIAGLRTTFDDAKTWDRLATDGTPLEKAAAERRARELG